MNNTKIAVYLPTDELKIKALKLMEKLHPKWRWCAGQKPTEFIPYRDYISWKNEFGQGRKEWYEKDGYKILNYEQLLEYELGFNQQVEKTCPTCNGTGKVFE